MLFNNQYLCCYALLSRCIARIAIYIHFHTFAIDIAFRGWLTISIHVAMLTAEPPRCIARITIASPQWCALALTWTPLKSNKQWRKNIIDRTFTKGRQTMTKIWLMEQRKELPLGKLPLGAINTSSWSSSFHFSTWWKLWGGRIAKYNTEPKRAAVLDPKLQLLAP